MGLLSKKPLTKAGEGDHARGKAAANGKAGASETLQALDVPAEALAEASTKLLKGNMSGCMA